MINFDNIIDKDLRKICYSYNDKILKKNKFQFFLRKINLLKNELLFFIQKLFKKSSIQSNQRIKDYNIHWSKFNFENYKFKPYVWHKYQNDVFLSPGNLTQEIFQSLIISEIKKNKFTSILEVGCGIGLNIFNLAKQFPSINFTGIDNSDVAINFCKKNNNFKNVEFIKENAVKINFKDNYFDMTYTVLALEQMQQIQKEVIKKITQITKDRIILIEPFRDVNQNFIEYIHTKNSDYFNLNYNDLLKYDLEINNVEYDFPQRIGLSAAFVCLKKI
jgi:SAM-dependent methyltransferase